MWATEELIFCQSCSIWGQSGITGILNLCSPLFWPRYHNIGVFPWLPALLPVALSRTPRCQLFHAVSDEDVTNPNLCSGKQSAKL